MAKKTKEINVGGVRLGGGNPVVIQSMTNTPTQDIEKRWDRFSAWPRPVVSWCAWPCRMRRRPGR